MFKLLDILLRRIVHRGSLTLIDADGTSHRFGDGRPPGVVVRLADKRLARQLVTDPELALAEAYMRGRLQMVEGRIYDFLELVLSNLQAKRISMQLNDDTVARGRRVYAEIERLAGGERFSIVLDGARLASGRASTRGTAVVGFTIPVNATTGSRLIRAVGQFPDRVDRDVITIR